MSKANIAKWCAGALLVGFTVASQAATISLSPSSQNVVVGNQVSLTLNMDFTGDPTVGGGIDIFYDSSKLSFVSFVFDSGLGDDPAFRRQPDNFTGELNGLAFGSFAGLSGPSPVGTLTFNTIGTGSVTPTMADNDFPMGSFFSSESPYGQQTVTYQSTSMNITAVPLPAAMWLMLSGMGLIGAVSRKKSS